MVGPSSFEYGSRLADGDFYAENTFACMKAAYDSGINFFDCAEAYSAGKSEEVMGRAIKHFGYIPLPSQDWGRLS